MIGRRGFMRGAGLLLAAPAIVRASSLMAVAPLPSPVYSAPAQQWGDTIIFTADDVLTVEFVRATNEKLREIGARRVVDSFGGVLFIDG